MNKIILTGLPFQPKPNQVFYIENEYDAKINNIIRSNYFEIESKFAKIGMEFCYLPYVLNKQQIEAKIRYYAPYLSSKVITKEVKSNALVQYISDDEIRKSIKSSLIFGGMQAIFSTDFSFYHIALG